MNYLTVLRPLSIIVIVLSAIWLQTHTIISGDITWLMHVGQSLLAGGHYYKNFIEVNTPMAIYIYLVPVLLSHYLKISFITSITLYTFIIVGLGWLVSCYLLNKLFSPADRNIRYTIEIALASFYFILPAYAFGQREHFLVILTLPYLLLAVLRLQQHTIKLPIAISIGIVAGIGFAIKPFFLLPWVFIELYMLLKTRTLTIWLRSETLSGLSLFLLYTLSIFLLTPQYITQTKALIEPVYYLNYQVGFIFAITHRLFIFSLIVLIIYSCLRKSFRYQALGDLLALSTFAMMIDYLVQRTIWFYHLLPMFMYAVLLFTFITAIYLQSNNIFKATTINLKLAKILTTIFCLILLATYTILIFFKLYKDSFNLTNHLFNSPIYSLVKSYRNRPIYIFTTNIAINYPLIDYTNTYSPSAFPCLWLIPAAHKLIKLEPQQQTTANKIADFARQTDINNIIKYKPALILVQQTENFFIVNKQLLLIDPLASIKKPSYDLLGYFLQDQRFANFWHQYQYAGQYGDFAVYKKRKQY